MFKKSKLCSGLWLAFGGTLMMAALPSMAQQAIERVEVTGSRIKSLGAASNSPITSVGADEINASQPIAVEEVVRNLAASVPAVGPGTNNGSGGGATIDLRGLQPQRTLVLINGRRMVPFDLLGRVDTNSIPVALLDRIDLLTGGASAVYGADAVSGVVNFVLKKNFTGIEASTSYGLSGDNDAKRYRSDVTLGANLAEGRGNVSMSIGTTRSDPLRQGQREIGKVQIQSADGSPQGSQTSVPAVLAGLPAPLTGSRTLDTAAGALRAYTTSDGYNFNPLNYFVTPLERTQLTALGRFTINEFAEAYAELTHSNSKVTLNLAPSGTFNAAWQLPIGNAFIPEGVRRQLCTAFNIAAANCIVGNTQEVTTQIRRRFVEFGPRVNEFDNKTTQWTVGLKGALPMAGDWSYDAYLQQGTMDQLQSRIDWGSASKVQQALRAVSTTQCLNTANGCVPLNLFGPAGSITPAMANFVNLTSVGTTFVKQNVATLTANGDLGSLKSPLAKQPVSMAVGLERREMRGGNRSDAPAQVQGEVLGTGAPTPDVQGSIKLNEAFVETMVPLVQGAAFAHSMNFEAGYRATDFKTSAGGSSYGSWKYGLDWAPIKGLRFRAMQQRATRAPSLNELYAPVITGLANLATDPCQGALINRADANTSGTLSNLCRATGVPLAQVGNLGAPSSGQINNTQGGDPALGPEEADTTTLGLVWEPTSMPGFSLTFDAYKIVVDKAISNIPAAQSVQACYDRKYNPTLDPTALLCSFIQRDRLTGGLDGGLGVLTPQSNLGRYNTRGIDIGVNYRVALKDLGLGAQWGRVDIGLNATRATQWEFKARPALETLNCLGIYGLNCGGPTPKLKFSQRLNWNVGDFTVGYNWRYQSKAVEEPGGDEFLPAFSSIKAYSYVDLNAAWNVTKNARVSLAIANAFNKQPPAVGNTIGGTGPNSGNTFPQAYDVVGRYFTVGATLKF
jgi:iron complex outermembrane recepter protein